LYASFEKIFPSRRIQELRKLYLNLAKLDAIPEIRSKVIMLKNQIWDVLKMYVTVDFLITLYVDYMGVLDKTGNMP
jgi:hypothetical protein